MESHRAEVTATPGNVLREPIAGNEGQDDHGSVKVLRVSWLHGRLPGHCVQGRAGARGPGSLRPPLPLLPCTGWGADQGPSLNSAEKVLMETQTVSESSDLAQAVTPQHRQAAED